MSSNSEALRGIISTHGLTRREVSKLTRKKKSTVDAWLAPADSDWHRPMPDSALRLLELEIENEGK